MSIKQQTPPEQYSFCILAESLPLIFLILGLTFYLGLIPIQRNVSSRCEQMIIQVFAYNHYIILMMHYTAQSGLQEFMMSTTDDSDAFQGTGTGQTTAGIPLNLSLSLRRPNKTNITITIQAYPCIWFLCIHFLHLQYQ